MALILKVVFAVVNFVSGLLPDRPPRTIVAPKPRKPPKPRSEIPAKAGEFFARSGPRFAAKVIGIAFLVLVALALIGGLIVVLIVAPLEFLLYVGVVVGILLVGTAVAWVAITLGERWDSGGAKAVKTNTCPRIEVKG